MDPAEIHQQLLKPGAYPESTTAVLCRETHISRVYLTDHHAYKLKKPLDLGFLDFSTLVKRRFFCQEEVRLNRRFAPDIYLGVVSLRDDHGTLRFGRKGRLVDYAVHMRRLPEKRMLSHLLDAADPTLPSEIERLAAHLAALLARTEPYVSKGAAASVRANLLDNLRQTETAIGLTLSAAAHELMSTWVSAELARLTPLIERRSTGGYVHDGHGDLHTANICMTEPIQVYDCIEFCRRLRVIDVAADLAFLLMDLDARNRRDLAGIFLDAYRQRVRDRDLTVLLPLYKSYRAWVRGKVNTLLGTEGDVATGERERALGRARRYFNLALGYLVAPTLIMTAGLTGVGKSTVAKALAAATGAHLLRSDVVRKELAGLPVDRPSADPFGSGLYTTAMNTRTYAELLQQAAGHLGRGEMVIVDAAFTRNADRSSFFAMAADLGRPALLLHLSCPPATTLERLDRRQRQGGDPSDGRRDIYTAQAAVFEPLPPQLPFLEIDSTQDVDYNIQKILGELLRG